MEARKRAFKLQLSGNRKFDHELTDFQRVAIVALVVAGKSYRDAASLLDCSLGAVQAALRRFDATHSFKSLPRPGQPEKLSNTEKRAIVRSAKVNFRKPYRELAAEWNGKVSLNTIKRVLQKARYRKWVAMKRPFITAEAAALRLQFAKEWLKNPQELMAVRLLL